MTPLASSSRRSFLKRTALPVAAPLILPSRVWSQATAPSMRLTFGCIGMGKQMKGHVGALLGRDETEILAACDVDTTRREAAKKRVDEAYTKKAGETRTGCAAYHDFRELLARQDLDAVVIATPDHWHTFIAIAAVLAGKDVSFHGTEGVCHVNRGKFELIIGEKTVHKFWDKEIDKATSMEREVTLTEREYLAEAKVRLSNSKSHFQDFLDCVRSRQRPICDVEIGASSVIACHLMNFAYHYGANARWNPERNRFASGGNSKWLTRERYRDKWGV